MDSSLLEEVNPFLMEIKPEKETDADRPDGQLKPISESRKVVPRNTADDSFDDLLDFAEWVENENFQDKRSERRAIEKVAHPILCTDRVIRRPENYEEHLDIVEERKKFARYRDKHFICDICNRTFTLLQNLANHAFLYHHPREQSLRKLRELPTKYRCMKCDKIFSDEARALRHDKAAHSWVPMLNKPMHVCEVCRRVFSSKSLLREHVTAVHDQARPYECKTCGQKFGRPGGLRRHETVVHGDVNYKCTYEGCDHPPYKCRKALAAHIRSKHTFVRPYKCHRCEKAFVRSNDLRMHETTHLRYKKYSCDHCDAKFRREASLRKHRLRCKAFPLPRIKLARRCKVNIAAIREDEEKKKAVTIKVERADSTEALADTACEDIDADEPTISAKVEPADSCEENSSEGGSTNEDSDDNFSDANGTTDSEDGEMKESSPISNNDACP